MQKAPAEDEIRATCKEIEEMLVEKNRAYGNSALEPVRLFSKADAVEQILVRIDDKLSRLSRGQAAGEDVEKDLLGYLVLLRIARKRADSTASCIRVDAASDRSDGTITLPSLEGRKRRG